MCSANFEAPGQNILPLRRQSKLISQKTKQSKKGASICSRLLLIFAESDSAFVCARLGPFLATLYSRQPLYRALLKMLGRLAEYTPCTTPIEIKVVTSDVPPDEKNGSVTPTTGSTDRHMPTLRTIWHAM